MEVNYFSRELGKSWWLLAALLSSKKQMLAEGVMRLLGMALHSYYRAPHTGGAQHLRVSSAQCINTHKSLFEYSTPGLLWL